MANGNRTGVYPPPAGPGYPGAGFSGDPQPPGNAPATVGQVLAASQAATDAAAAAAAAQVSANAAAAVAAAAAPLREVAQFILPAYNGVNGGTQTINLPDVTAATLIRARCPANNNLNLVLPVIEDGKSLTVIASRVVGAGTITFTPNAALGTDGVADAIGWAGGAAPAPAVGEVIVCSFVGLDSFWYAFASSPVA